MENILNLAPSSQFYGFMELLGLQDHFTPYYNSSHNNNNMLDDMFLIHHHEAPVKSSLVAPISSLWEAGTNQPATPNASSSVWSASSEAAATDLAAEEEEGGDLTQHEGGGEEDEEKSKKKNVKGNKKGGNEKKKREPRFAFLTKSEVDHLEDGYRWRKYGQKAVKNSSFPRSYYRCTAASCNVKKRVERSHTDPATVVTTYEGQHTHSAGLIRPPLPPPEYYSAFSGMTTIFSPAPNISRLTGPCYCASPTTVNDLSPLTRSGQSQTLLGSTSAAGIVKRRFCPPESVVDHGLLEDVVPSHVLKEEM